jgi:preprotein translocase subunit SecD
VSFLAAAILYYFAAGDVKGFAFTLGLSTILDLVTVFLFTHPLVSLLSRMRLFGTAAFTGLDAIRGGVALADAPAPRSPRAGPKPPRKQAKPTAEAAITDEPGSVVVLDDDSRATEAGTTDVEPGPQPSAEPDAVAEPEAQDAESDDRTYTNPAPGTAAERAAARRARMRAEKGKS